MNNLCSKNFLVRVIITRKLKYLDLNTAGSKSGRNGSDSASDSSDSLYDSRKYGHCLPENIVSPNFEGVLNFPTGIFRCTSGELLGPCADKCQMYKNPEYFSYHNMSYFDLHLLMRALRKPSPEANRKPNYFQ